MQPDFFKAEETRSPRDKSEVHLILELRCVRDASIAVSNPATKTWAQWVWLPRALVTYVTKGPGLIEATMPRYLAQEKGLL